MSLDDAWSPDQPLGTETFEQGDEATDEEELLDPDLRESIELDPSLDPTLQADERELEEVGARFNDPEEMVVLEGGIDDPDGLGGPLKRVRSHEEGNEGWELDPPLVRDEGNDPTAAD